MPSTNSPYPPVSYHSLWLVLGVICLCLVVLLYGLVLWLTRRQKTDVAIPTPLTKPDLPALRTKYLGLIAELERAGQSGALSARAVHQKLSVLLRFFVYEAEGVPAQVLTLTDLQQAKLPKLSKLTAAIASYYPPEFRSLPPGESTAALDVAREVVTSWA